MTLLKPNTVKIQEAYTSWAATYDQDRNLTRDLDELVTRKMLGDRRCQKILEIGCGTGKNTALLAEIGQSVSALDFSEGMIEQAKEKLQLDNVTFGNIKVRKPIFNGGQQTTEIQAFVHHLSDFTNAAADHGFSLKSFREWWHEQDQNKPPRLVSFVFEKGS